MNNKPCPNQRSDKKICFICSQPIEETPGWSYVVWQMGSSDLHSDMFCLFDMWRKMTQEIIDNNIPDSEDSE